MMSVEAQLWCPLYLRQRLVRCVRLLQHGRALSELHSPVVTLCDVYSHHRVYLARS